MLHQKLCREMTVDAKLYVLKICAADMIALCNLVVRRPLIKKSTQHANVQRNRLRRRKIFTDKSNEKF
jgi:hypothetical protein